MFKKEFNCSLQFEPSSPWNNRKATQEEIGAKHWLARRYVIFSVSYLYMEGDSFESQYGQQTTILLNDVVILMKAKLAVRAKLLNIVDFLSIM